MPHLPPVGLAMLQPGRRGVVGVIQPAAALMLDAEWQMAMPDGVAFPVTRLPLAGGLPEHYRAMADRADDAAAILANAGVGAIAYACGIGSLYGGPAEEQRLLQRLSRAAGGVPALGMAEAAVQALRHLGARRVALLTPYPAEVSRLVKAYLAQSGFETAGTFRLPTESALTAMTLRPEETTRAAVEALRRADRADALWIPCSAVRTLGLIDAIERATGCPVISSNQAMLWRVLQVLGVPANRPAGGRLFEGLTGCTDRA